MWPYIQQCLWIAVVSGGILGLGVALGDRPNPRPWQAGFLLVGYGAFLLGGMLQLAVLGWAMANIGFFPAAGGVAVLGVLNGLAVMTGSVIATRIVGMLGPKRK